VDPFSERVLDLVDRIPPGRVLTYGMVADLVDSGARQVGQVMARDGSGVPWWRVVRADGSLPHSLVPEALDRYAEENTPLNDDGRTVDMERAVWQDAGEFDR
jgi:alkylated DNA nucleotide flippase Atl1